MRVSKEAWLIAAIAIPLTIVTIAIWWLWPYWNPMRMLKIVWKVRFPELRGKEVKSVSLLFSKRKSKPVDVESAVTVSGHTVIQCEMSRRTLCESSVPTWSTTASTVKNGEDWV